ncbi:MAG: murein L,D-transpeptidase catalytic domain family protein [Ferruginibacter sp.]|nr:murein L,D-transpeptidase catalytic domain family protein [Ferruginibacter sp.]
MGHTKSTSVNTGYHLPKPFSSISVNNFPVNTIPASITGVKSDRYNLWQLGNAGLSEIAFNYAIKGLGYLNAANIITKRNIVSIVDFSKPSTQKRLFVIDLSSGKILFNTWVAHGRNSGNEYANEFSNLPESHQTSLGFYITMGTYTGGNGYSLRLQGCEKGINDKAFERAIVIHGADYVSNRFINSRGMLGRSYGCPAIPTELSKKIIDVIKNGSCIFLYHPTKKYCTRSKIITSQV